MESKQNLKYTKFELTICDCGEITAELLKELAEILMKNQKIKTLTICNCGEITAEAAKELAEILLNTKLKTL